MCGQLGPACSHLGFHPGRAFHLNSLWLRYCGPNDGALYSDNEACRSECGHISLCLAPSLTASSSSKPLLLGFRVHRGQFWERWGRGWVNFMPPMNYVMSNKRIFMFMLLFSSFANRFFSAPFSNRNVLSHDCVFLPTCICTFLCTFICTDYF